jgi:hypothetical protein
MSRPKLPSKMPGGASWPKETREWLARWDDLAPAQYDELLLAALAHATLWRDGANASLLAEMRKRTALLEKGRRAQPAPAPVKRDDLRLIREEA